MALFERKTVQFVAALLLLNGLLSFSEWWPTLAVMPDARIAPELGILVIALSIALAAGKVPSQRLMRYLACAYVALILGRYLDVVAPALFGRPISLYWDVPQLPRFIWVTVTGSPVWMTVLSVVGLVLIAWGLYRLILTCLHALADGLQTLSRKPALWAVQVPLSLLIGANYAGVQATWPYVSKPVLPTYLREVGIVLDALDPQRANRLLPASTVIDQALKAGARKSLSVLDGRDLTVMFLESHGAVMYDNADFARQIQPGLQRWQDSLKRHGFSVVSAFYTSPTIGGASDLAHLSFLSGIDLKDPRRHDLLLTTQRPTLLSVFRQAGYETLGLYHSVHWDWVERTYYGFDTYLSGPDLAYEGPAFGFWKIPDQYALARLEQLHPRTPDRKPRVTVTSTMATHFPFVPVPPYQPDWQRVLGPDPFDADATGQALARPVNWMDMAPDYVRTLQYAHTWLADWFAQQAQVNRTHQREQVYVLLGDHQPTSNIAGNGASWDVPVYVIARDERLLAQFVQAGFSEGMTPVRRQSLGGLHDLTGVVLSVFGQSGHHIRTK